MVPIILNLLSNSCFTLQNRKWGKSQLIKTSSIKVSHKIFPFIENGLHMGRVGDVQMMLSGAIWCLAAKSLDFSLLSK